MSALIVYVYNVRSQVIKREVWIDNWIYCSVVVKALCYKPEGHGVETR
jgi:hypothetical protein